MTNKIATFLIIIFCCQSCISYRNFDIKSQIIKDKHTFIITKNSKFIKVKLVSIADSILTYRVGKLQQQIHLRDIRAVKYKKVNVTKTIGLVTLTTAAVILVSHTDSGYKYNAAPR